ncbi:MAG: OmpA family protein [Gemmatimonadales bacterium]
MRQYSIPFAALATALLLAPAAAAQTQPEASGGVWRNYDFVPGRRVLAAVDFTGEPVGRFPATALRYVRGTAQIVSRENKAWLESTSNSVVQLVLPEDLGDAFSVEFTARIPTANIGISLFPTAVEGSVSRYADDFLSITARPGIYRARAEVSAIRMTEIVKRDVAVKLQVVRNVAIAYVDSVRIGLVPTARFPGGRVLEFHLEGNARFPTYLTDIVVAAGLDDLYDALLKEGEVTTRGILFDSSSDRLRPESVKVLTDLVDALTRADTLAVTIEGHTDAEGADDFNQALSERRARAVVAYLVEHGVAAARLTAVGKGESEPVAPNDTPAGRQENRRVKIKVTR